METTFKIIETDWTAIKPVWSQFLWPQRPPAEITPISSMQFLGGYDLDIKKNRPYFWLIEDQDQVLGTISGFLTGPSQFRSRGIWVADAARRQGLALKLFDALKTRALELDCRAIWSYPRMSALPAYEKFGFGTVGNPIYTDSDPYSPHIYVEIQL